VIKHFFIQIIPVTEVIIKPAFCHAQTRGKDLHPHGLNPPFLQNLQREPEPVRFADPGFGFFFCSLDFCHVWKLARRTILDNCTDAYTIALCRIGEFEKGKTMTLWTKVLPAVLLTAVASASQAEPLSFSGLDETRWRHDLTLYAFLPARSSGTSTVAGTQVPIDLSLSEAVELLDGAIAGRYEAWNNDWGILVDLNYISLEAGGTLPVVPLELSVDIKQSWLGILGSYRVTNTAYGTEGRRVAVDLQAGVRYNSLQQEVSASPSPPPFPLGGTERWWEPVIGARGMWEINDRWAAILEADAGGFGVGGNDLQFGVNALLDWKPWENTSLKFGYRYYSIDFSTTRSDGVFAYNVEQHGPYLGVTWRFQ